MTELKWYEYEDYRSAYIKTKAIKMEIKEWKATFGLPIVNKKFKNYKLMRKWFPKHRYDKRGFLKIEIRDELEKKIERMNKKCCKKYLNDVKEKEYKKSVGYKEGYPKYLRCKLRMGYDQKTKKFLNNVQTPIFYNGEKKYNVTLEDLEKMMYKVNNTKLEISINKIWENNEMYGCNWTLDKIEIEKVKSQLEGDSDSDGI